MYFLAVTESNRETGGLYKIDSDSDVVESVNDMKGAIDANFYFMKIGTKL